jgi:apolipoprotein N-acyltransferase
MTTYTETKTSNSIAEMTVSKRIGIAIALSVLSGAFLFLAFPPVNIWPFIWIAIVPYLVAQHRFMPRRFSALAPTISYGLWLWPFLYRIFGIPDAPLWLKHVGLLVAVLIFFTSTERKFHELTSYRWFILQGVFSWVGFEMVRSFIPVLGTMGFIANPLAGQPWLIQGVSIFSIYGLNLLVILVNFTLAQTVMHWIDQKWVLGDNAPVNGSASRRWLLGAGLAVIIWVSISLMIYFQTPQDTETIRVAALHMNLDTPGHQVDEAEQRIRLQLLREQALEAAAQGADAIFVPEMAFGFDPHDQHTDELRALAAEIDAYIFFPYAVWDDEGWHNENIVISPSGEFSPIYGKRHPFGEPPSVSAGTFPVTDTPYGTLGSIICMDGVFTDAARKISEAGAQLIAIPTFNTTIGISEQNWNHFVFRSVENRVPVVNADRGYYSMITDSRGRIMEEVNTPLGESAVIVADVQLGNANSPYLVLEDWLGWVSLAGFVFFIIFQSVVERRAKKETPSS